MRIKANGGLVNFAADAGSAANEDEAADRSVPAEERDSGTAGWDPYEVWLTRVRGPRRNRDAPDAPGNDEDA
jgi:hypothetical protein